MNREYDALPVVECKLLCSVQAGHTHNQSTCLHACACATEPVRLISEFPVKHGSKHRSRVHERHISADQVLMAALSRRYVPALGCWPLTGDNGDHLLSCRPT